MSETTAAALHRRGVLARNMPRAGAASRLPFFYFHGDYEGGGFYCLALAGHTGPDQPFYALAPPGHDGGPIPPDVPAIAEVQLAMLRGLQPAGPYRLGGFCNGGLVAFEIARRLVAAGEQVERLVLIAPVVPTAGGPLARLAERAQPTRVLRRADPASARPAPGRAGALPRRSGALDAGAGADAGGAGRRRPATADGRSAAAQRDLHAKRPLLPPRSVCGVR
jgi:thioesterase domain-containing protein